jgi:hypothetical protein
LYPLLIESLIIICSDSRSRASDLLVMPDLMICTSQSLLGYLSAILEMAEE